ncbi:hypothetical protein LZ023_39310 (plasmid) [Pseudomonas silvicola]|nr:hypothetical protein LZ023_39310 [Pseudomonas silvicola]
MIGIKNKTESGSNGAIGIIFSQRENGVAFLQAEQFGLLLRRLIAEIDGITAIAGTRFHC